MSTTAVPSDRATAYLPGPIGGNKYRVNLFHPCCEARLRAALQL